MRLYYIWDAYCGWCYGFKEVLRPFIAKHPELELDILSGGLFDQGKSISAYPHIPDANQQISKIFKVDFGQPYQEILAEGQLVLNSYHAAAGFGVLKKYLPRASWMVASDLLQNAFYQEGHSLSDPQTYQLLAQEFKLSSPAFNQELLAALSQPSGSHEDIEVVRSFGVSSYPTLILEKGGKYYDLRAGAMSSDELERNFEVLKAL